MGWDKTKERKKIFQYQWSVPLNRIEWKNSIHDLKLKRIDLSYLSIVYEIYGFHWCKFNHFNLQFKMRKNPPLVTNSYPLSGGKSYLKSGKIMFLLLQERTNRVSYPTKLHNLIPLLYKVYLVRKDLLLETSWVEPKSGNCTSYQYNRID